MPDTPTTRRRVWTDWPASDAVHRSSSAHVRRVGGWVRAALLALVLVVAVVKVPGGSAAPLRRVALSGLIVLMLATSVVARRMALRRRLSPVAGALAVLAACVAGSQLLGSELLALGLLCVPIVSMTHLAPVWLAVAYTGAADAALVLAEAGRGWHVFSLLAGACLLVGYLSRQDREARAVVWRLLAQERAARAAEQIARDAQAESAALNERARIAREIHDVLAHSLSAQLVHLETARLVLQHGADTEKVTELVVNARRMAQEGLVETRQALSALRGEHMPITSTLADMGGELGAEVCVEGEPRPLGGEASHAVRRVAQEALTNIRKHARGHVVTIRLEYGQDTVRLEVVDRASGPDLSRGATAGTPTPMAGAAVSGPGYGLRGMRERAEILGGSLDAGPTGEGFRVLLELPV
ncbi:histidine kinase [Streptomyces monashensis]|uniref:sensor histidine kinase n=1 Tax=Streptomyces monashensis TaxID=1678012 RepID=UPI0033F465A0